MFSSQFWCIFSGQINTFEFSIDIFNKFFWAIFIKLISEFYLLDGFILLSEVFGLKWAFFIGIDTIMPNIKVF